MRPFQIFRPGRHTSSNGSSLSFTEDDLKASVAAYDPALHEAPIVVGHPKDNGPAYGWVKSLAFDEQGAIVAEPQQIDEQFAEMVQAGRFKKRSASFYTPDSPANPKPGVFYLRHVGFLGAQAPAVKGLKDVNFADTEEGVVEFADAGLVSIMFRRLRDFFLAEYGAEKADQVLPAFYVEDLEAEARREADKMAPPTLPSFSEDSDMTQETDAIRAELDAAKAKITELEGAAAKVAEFSEREAALASREAALARKGIEAELDDLVKAGKVLPAEKAALVSFMATLEEGEASIDFGEGDAAEKVNPRDFMRRFLSSRPKVVDYAERTGETRNGADESALSDQDVADKARAKVKAARAEGKSLSFTEAVGQVRAELLAQ